MTIAELCVLGAIVLIIASIAPGKFSAGKKYDNANPRDPSFYTPGLRARALGAHQNGFETFPFFIAAVLLAEMRGVPQGTVNGLAVGFLLARVAYVACYLADRPTLRSVAWSFGFLLNIALFLSPWWAGR